ncbi:MAG: Holliday junction branch migration protein RuvA [Planctomycetes bacterium]|nr:Holliday junction branch migration protein RuvA [Planctomycetota bacterium]
MYHHVTGELVELTPTRAVIEAAGVGYELSISLATYQAIKNQRQIRLLTHLLVREDLLRLFGFATAAERELFRTIISVAGIGPATALAILSSFGVEEFKAAVLAGDAAAIRKIKGIGPKIADRLLVELKDRFPPSFTGARAGLLAGASQKLAGREFGQAAEALAGEALRALLELGFSRKDGEKRVRAAVTALSENLSEKVSGGSPAQAAGLTVEAVIAEALRSGA